MIDQNLGNILYERLVGLTFNPIEVRGPMPIMKFDQSILVCLTFDCHLIAKE